MAQRPSCAFPNEKLQAARTVLSAQDFYDYANEHFGWAETAMTERERAIFFSNDGSLARGRSKVGNFRQAARREVSLLRAS